MGVTPCLDTHTIVNPVMNHSEFKNLATKFINGTASEQEKAALFEYYERSQTIKGWDEELMGDKDMVEARLYHNIQHQIAKKESRQSFQIWKVAASVALMIGIGALSLQYFIRRSVSAGATSFHTVSAVNRLVKVTLSDGTLVWVNNGSSLRYPENFSEKSREVYLEGEAFFDVKHQPEPFIIRSGKMVTQVLGTSFNVKAFADDNVSTVSVLSGKVGVILPGIKQKQVVFLTRNQELAFNKQNNAVNKIAAIDATQAIDWIANKIKFRNTPFAQAMSKLEDVYGVQIGYANGLKSCPVFADFNRSDKVYKVLNMLAKSLGGKVIKKDDKNYFLTGKPCK